MEFRDIEFATLIDMLAQHTTKYSKLLVEGDKGDEFEEIKNKIKLIQTEINIRRYRAEKAANFDSPSDTQGLS